MRRVFMYGFLLVFLSGCASLGALMDYSQEQEALQRQVSEQKKKIERLFSDIDDNKLSVGKTSKKEVVRRYGEPVLVEENNGQEQLLYRQEMEYFSAKKVYLFFDAEGMLTTIDVVLKPSLESSPE